jgi:aspT/yidE/ybjL antiporter duplication domain
MNAANFLMLSVFAIAAFGYILGRITIKGISLGTAGVFVIALIYGGFFGVFFNSRFVIEEVNYASQALKIVENLGLVFFVTSVGFIAGPNFFKNMKKNFKSYVLLGLVIILSGGIAAIACILIGRVLESGTDPKQLTAIITGLLSGSLTSTPAFSATKEAVAAQYQDAVTVGYGIAYLFGVIGVVLFVQLMPRIVHADMAEEVRKITHVETGDVAKFKGKLLEFDDFGFTPFAAAAVLGILIGSVRFFGFFSLTTTGGTLLVSLVFGHFGHVGRADLMPSKKVLETFRELGLMVFLIGAGVSGGMSFVRYFRPIYFVYGVVMTLLPMVLGYLVAKYVLKLNLLNILGSITGGMTSTPALGTLIHVAGTSNVASAYAATYPIALIAVVLVTQFLVRVF